MDIEKLLQYSDRISRADSVIALKDILEMIKNINSEPFYTIYYSEGEFSFEWGLCNSDKGNCIRLFFGRSDELVLIFNDSEIETIITVEMSILPSILFSIAVRIIIATRTTKINQLFSVSDMSNKLFKNVLKRRINDTKKYDVETEMMIRKEIKSTNSETHLGLAVSDYFFDHPQKTEYTIFDDSLPFFFLVAGNCWLCPRPGAGAYRIQV